jgi:putative DNA primase/helicase
MAASSSEFSSATERFALVPEELKAREQWVAYRLVRTTNRKKPDKVPFDPRTGKKAKVNDPHTWSSYEVALQTYAQGGYDGLGFVFSRNDPYAGVDLDSEGLASYTELSPSACGIHILVKAVLPAGRRKNDDVEMYDDKRFFTMTGNQLPGMPCTIEERQQAVLALHAKIFGSEGRASSPAAATGTAAASRMPQYADSFVLQKARDAKNGAAFCRLFDRGDWTGYRSASEADLALCSFLAFFTGPCPANEGVLHPGAR